MAKVLYRNSQVADSPEDGNLKLAFSSEQPVLRTGEGTDHKKGERYWEVLDHDPANANIELLQNRGAFLDEHDFKRPLGVIESAEICADKMGRAEISFCEDTLSKDRSIQLRTKKRPHISFGYIQTKCLSTTTGEDGIPVKRFAFQAYEISSVAVPADTTVGVGRSLTNDEENRMDEFLKNEPISRHLKGLVLRGGSTTISANDVANSVCQQVACDERFMGKDNKGNLTGYTSVRDLVHDGDQWHAIVYASTDQKTYQIALNVKDSNVKLGEAQEVIRKDNYVPASRSLVDSNKLAESDKSKSRNLMENEITPEQKSKLRAELTAELEPTLRTKVEGEIKTRSGEATTKLANRNKEIKARSDEFCKEHGRNWAGKPGEVVVVADKIRQFEIEAYNASPDMSDSEVRMEFTRKADELIRGSRAPKNQEQAAELPNEIAARCSLRRMYNLAAEDQAKGNRCAVFMPKDGAEFEADRELRARALNFPGGNAHATEGFLMPTNMPVNGVRGTRSAIQKMQRDSLAGDFPTAGALIAPQYKFPTIELLRNKMALGRSNMTILSGVIGNLVLPRQVAPTTSQSLAEGAILNAFDQTFDQIRMAPHRIGSRQSYSRLALLQTTEDFEALVMDDHMQQNALRADYLGINGQGANDEPLGILNQIGIGSVVFGGSASAAYKNCVNLETLIRKSNIDEEPTFITTSVARGTLRITPATLTGSTVVSGETNALWVGDELIGRPATDTQQVPGDFLIALVARHLVMAQWGGWQVVLDTLTQADQDKIKLTMNTYIDYALRHPSAVARSADSIAVLA